MSSDYASIRVDETALPASMKQVAIAVLSGVAFWFAGAMICRYAHVWGVDTGAARLVLFALTVPATALGVRRFRLLTRALPQQLGPLVAITTGVAALGDVAALTWFPQIYTPDADAVPSASVYLFWGVAVALGLGFWPRRR
jgi:hypothetical protein